MKLLKDKPWLKLQSSLVRQCLGGTLIITWTQILLTSLAPSSNWVWAYSYSMLNMKGVRDVSNIWVPNITLKYWLYNSVNPAILERNSRDALNLKELRANNNTPPTTSYGTPTRSTPTKGIPTQITNRKSSLAISGGGSSGYYSNYTPPGGQVERKTSIIKLRY